MATRQELCDYDVLLPEQAAVVPVRPARRRWWRSVARLGGGMFLACAMIMDAIGGRFDR